MEIADISLERMGLLYLFLLIPMLLLWRLRVPLIRRLVVSAGRMTLQLVLVGLYLRYLFEWNSALLNLLWLAIMITVAAGHILRSAQLRRPEMFTSVVGSVVLALTVTLVPFIIGIVQPTPFYDARYLIPLGGMLLGNILSANIVALNHYAASLKSRKQELQTALCFGATRLEATLPFLRESFQRAMTPTVTTVGTLGLVSLPGMMTGQLLGGSFPMVAIKYQIAIMIAIVTAGSLSIFLTLLMVTGRFFDDRDNIRLELFREE
jgi:putative ABC transport system permease protein